MRHGKKFNHLGRTHEHRAAMLANMASSLIMHKRIKTTVAKAKALQKYVDPLITKSKEDTTHSRRIVFKNLKNKYAVTELFREVSQKVADRPGGYTRIIKLGQRLGDAAEMCIIELVDFNETLQAAGTTKKKATRRRGATKKKATPETVEAVVEEKAVEASAEVTEEASSEEATEDNK